MKKRMEQLINGEFEYIVPELILSEKEISVKVNADEKYQNEFYFGAEDNSKVKGMVFSTSRRIVLAKEKFSGSTVHMQYGIDTAGLSSGDICRGEIVICSNLGEYRIAVQAQIEEKQVKTSKGEIEDLDQFAALAKADYREAFRLFTKEAFLKLVKGEAKKFESLYKGMSQNPVTYQHMEEFLIGTGKKEAVELTVDKAEKEMLRIESSTKDTLYIYKNTWGYVRMEVEIEGDFLEIEKKIVTNDDFIGSVYGIEYVILWDKLGKGKKTGRIVVKSVYGSQVFQIQASAARDYQISLRSYEHQKMKELSLSYLQLAAKKIDYREWKEQTIRCLNELKSTGSFGISHQLYEAYVYYLEDDRLKTQELLGLLKNRTYSEEEAEAEGMYLYLSHEMGMRPPEAGSVSEALESLYRRNQDSFILLGLLLKVSEEFANSSVKKLHMLERQFEMGCTSPFLYLEAVKVIARDENQMKKLSPFMIQVLVFAAKYQMLTQELAMRISYLAVHEKRFRTSVYRILGACYEVYPGKDTLEAICKLVMLGSPGRRAYYKWYARAIEQDVRITRLYEYYIETMNKNSRVMLPQPVRLYFSYNNTLSSSKKAFVYANIIHNKDEDELTYQNYREAMAAFAKESLHAGKINEDYAVIYQEFLTNLGSKSSAEAAAGIAFAHRLYSDDPKVRNVIVCHSAFNREASYPVNDGVAYINIYSEDAQIIFEDSKRRRYVATVAYNLQKLIDNKEIVQQCVALDVEHPGLLLYQCGSRLSETDVNIRNLGCFQHVVESEYFTEPYKQEARRKLLEYYDRNAEDATINEYLRTINYREFYQVDCVLLIDILIRRGFAQEAFELICEYGYEQIDAASLLKLCRRMILDMEFAENEELIWLAYEVLARDRYDDVILMYLRDNYIGPVETMIKIWEKLKGFQVDTYAIEEEILLLAMFTRSYRPKLSKVLEGYVRNRGKEVVIVAAFTFFSVGYFLGDVRIDSFVFQGLQSVYEREWELDIVCKLALLKRYRFCKKLTSRQKTNVINILGECQKLGLRFSFFREFPGDCTKSFQLEDKVFVEEVLHPKARVTIHYALSRGEEAGDLKFKSEPMQNVYHGIFTREFLLFYGERLTWYLTIELGDTVRTTEWKTLLMDTITSEGKTKYQMLNQMLANRKLRKESVLDAAMEKYLKTEQLAEQIFILIE